MKIVKQNHTLLFKPLSDLSLPKHFYLKFKRLYDFVFASLFLVLFFPILAIIAITVKVSSSGPIFYKWKMLDAFCGILDPGLKILNFSLSNTKKGKKYHEGDR